VTPRSTDWGLALLVSLLAATGLLTWFSGAEGQRWVFAAHAAAGASLAILLVWKLRRVGPRVLDPRRWDARSRAGLVALVLVVLALGTGLVWSTAGPWYLGGYSLLAWHAVVGAVLALVVLTHLALRAKRPRVQDLAGRRQVLEGGAILLGGLLAWRIQGPLYRLLGLPGSRRRFTGSYEADSFAGNAFPTTSWVADDPRPLLPERYQLEIGGLVAEPVRLVLSDLEAGDELEATLDCTGGFYSTQRWHGIALPRLLGRVEALPEATHVRVISCTGYRWGFGLEDVSEFLLATEVGGASLSHGHGAPARLVAPGRRGFQWIKWVVRLELTDDTDYGAFPSTILSSFSDAGRGRA
jgi:DMSO/TMAO reductase YedYZ molybdopterin-dependent catalytic subunit